MDFIAELNNRFYHHPPKDENTRKDHETIRQGCRGTAEIINALCPNGREKSIAITRLEEVMFWANAAIARQSDNTD